MNTKFKNNMNARYSSLEYPDSTLSRIGIDKSLLSVLENESTGYYLNALGGKIPNYIHAAMVKLMSYGFFQVDVASNVPSTKVGKNEQPQGQHAVETAVVEYTSDVEGDNSAIVIYKDSTSGNLVRICSYKGGNALPENSLEWLASLIVGVIIADNKMALLTDFITAAKNEVAQTASNKDSVTKAYFKLVEPFFEKIMDVDGNVMFTSSLSDSYDLNTITKEYVQNTTDFDDCKAILSMQSYFLQEPDAQYFTFIRPKTDVEIKAKIAKKMDETDFSITGSRKFDETEQEMMANTALRMVNYIPTQIAVDMVAAFYATNKCSFGSPLRAAMLYGPSGTGKTEMVQYLGYKLGLPVTTFSCSANTDEYDLLGKPISLGVTGEGDGKIVYTETELTKAIKNGWVIEIQEASVVKETAVHQIFNSLFDGTELVQLPDGSMITPHPNFIAVFTTNVSYEGCNAMNQSLISRNQFVAEIQLPSKEETISRLKTQLNWPESKSTEAIDLAVQCMQKINEFLQEENLEDGSCDFRCIKDWLQMYLAYNEVGIKKSLLDLADYCIIPKATLDSEYHHDIRAICSAIIPAA